MCECVCARARERRALVCVHEHVCLCVSRVNELTTIHFGVCVRMHECIVHTNTLNYTAPRYEQLKHTHTYIHKHTLDTYTLSRTLHTLRAISQLARIIIIQLRGPRSPMSMSHSCARTHTHTHQRSADTKAAQHYTILSAAQTHNIHLSENRGFC